MKNINLSIDNDHVEAQSFYTSVDYHTLIKFGDLLVSARLAGEIIGLVRLSLERNILILRGMFIAEAYQKRGIGSLMLKELSKHIEEDCYCLSHSWLESFYSKVGFKRINES